MRALILLGLLAMAGCQKPPSMGPEAYVSSPTAVSLRATPDRRQAVEDAANIHCGASGLVPRLTNSGLYSEPRFGFLNWVYFYRYECAANPRR